MRNKRKGLPLMALGVLLIGAAFLLTGYNLWEERRAGSEAEAIVEQIRQALLEEEALPAYALNPDMEMPVITIDGSDYIGVLTIPVLGLEIPVMAEWSYPSLKIAPCRYTGSVYKNDMVIAGHNYKTHFGRLKKLSPGNTVLFTDTDGNMFSYQVVELETLPPTAVEDMKTGDWDLTLFTCTLGGKSRVAVRCERTEANT